MKHIGKIEVLAHKEHIQKRLDLGWCIEHVYKELIENKTLTIPRTTFYRWVNRLIIEKPETTKKEVSKQPKATVKKASVKAEKPKPKGFKHSGSLTPERLKRIYGDDWDTAK